MAADRGKVPLPVQPGSGVLDRSADGVRPVRVRNDKDRAGILARRLVQGKRPFILGRPAAVRDIGDNGRGLVDLPVLWDVVLIKALLLMP